MQNNVHHPKLPHFTFQNPLPPTPHFNLNTNSLSLTQPSLILEMHSPPRVASPYLITPQRVLLSIARERRLKIIPPRQFVLPNSTRTATPEFLIRISITDSARTRPAAPRDDVPVRKFARSNSPGRVITAARAWKARESVQPRSGGPPAIRGSKQVARRPGKRASAHNGSSPRSRAFPQPPTRIYGV